MERDPSRKADFSSQALTRTGRPARARSRARLTGGKKHRILRAHLRHGTPKPPRWIRDKGLNLDLGSWPEWKGAGTRFRNGGPNDAQFHRRRTSRFMNIRNRSRQVLSLHTVTTPSRFGIVHFVTICVFMTILSLRSAFADIPDLNDRGDQRYFVILDEQLVQQLDASDEPLASVPSDPTNLKDKFAWHKPKVRKAVRILERRLGLTAESLTSHAMPRFPLTCLAMPLPVFRTMI